MAKTKLLLVPVSAAGHLSSTLQLAMALLQATGGDRFTVTVLHQKLPVASEEPLPFVASAIQSVASSGLDIHFQDLPAVHLPADAELPLQFATLFYKKCRPFVRSAIADSPVPVSALIIDFSATALIDVAAELGVPTYVYFASTALMLGLLLYLPTIDEEMGADSQFEDVEGGFRLPGISPIAAAASLPNDLLKRKSGNYESLLYYGRRFREARGIVVNTFQDLETEPLRLLAEGRFTPGNHTPAVYPIGPLLSLGGSADASAQEVERHECLTWLHEQPRGSVVFLCFGSLGIFDVEQLKEMADALERSGHRFLWVVRGRGPDWMTLGDAELDEVLPSGFLERTRERGMVWPSWAPQTAVLSHEAVGGFVTHGGWNSCLEGLWFGVPMLVWPLYAEQHLNAVEMVRDLGVAVGLEIDRKKGNYVRAEELERGVRCLMGEGEEGERVRARVEEMKVASRQAIEEGGSSSNYLKKLDKELGTQ